MTNPEKVDVGRRARHLVRVRDVGEEIRDAVYDLADEVDRLREELLKAELTAAFAQERERTVWEPLLVAAKEKVRKHRPGCPCPLEEVIAACEEKS